MKGPSLYNETSKKQSDAWLTRRDERTGTADGSEYENTGGEQFETDA